MKMIKVNFYINEKVHTHLKTQLPAGTMGIWLRSAISEKLLKDEGIPMDAVEKDIKDEGEYKVTDDASVSFKKKETTGIGFLKETRADELIEMKKFYKEDKDACKDAWLDGINYYQKIGIKWEAIIDGMEESKR